MRKRIIPAIFAIPLLLASCTSGEEDSTPADTTEFGTTTSVVPSGPVELELGETAHLTQGADGPRDITVTVTNISVSQQCHTGLNNYSDGPHDGYYNDHGYFIQVTGEFEVIEHQVGFSVSTWRGTTEDGYTVTFNPASECTDPHSDMPGYQSFSNPIDAGQKARAVEEYWVEELPQTLILDGPYEPVSYSWPVPQDVTNEGPDISTESPPAAQDTATQAPVAPEPEAQPTSIWTNPGEGYNCPRTDAWVIDASYCTPENLGAVPSQDPNTIPYSEGGPCPAAICGYGTNDQGQPNPTSGEIQTLDGCQQGYITDPQLCESVAWVETHQY